MRMYFNDYLISDEKELLQLDKIYQLLSTTYWAYNRDKKTIQESIDNSICFGVFKNNVQIGFARCVTDYSVIYWLCDVIIEDNYRGNGIGKKLIECVVTHEKLKNLRGILSSNDKHRKFYEQFGFEHKTSFMFKSSNDKKH